MTAPMAQRQNTAQTSTKRQESPLDYTETALDDRCPTKEEQAAMEHEAAMRYEVEQERRREVFGERI